MHALPHDRELKRDFAQHLYSGPFQWTSGFTRLARTPLGPGTASRSAAQHSTALSSSECEHSLHSRLQGPFWRATRYLAGAPPFDLFDTRNFSPSSSRVSSCNATKTTVVYVLFFSSCGIDRSRLSTLRLSFFHHALFFQLSPSFSSFLLCQRLNHAVLPAYSFALSHQTTLDTYRLPRHLTSYPLVQFVNFGLCNAQYESPPTHIRSLLDFLFSSAGARQRPSLPSLR